MLSFVVLFLLLGTTPIASMADVYETVFSDKIWEKMYVERVKLSLILTYMPSYRKCMMV
jgi:hypothetical protein